MAIQEKHLRTRFAEGEYSESEPARLLQEQAETISKEYAGILFGMVVKDLMPPRNSIVYFLDVAVKDKPFRFAPVFIRHNVRNEYPVLVTNTLESVGFKVRDAEEFQQQVRAILHDPAMRDQFTRMVEHAKEP